MTSYVCRLCGAWAIIWGIAGCGGDGAASSDSPPPAGACKTGGTATGTFSAACNQCGQEKCNAELGDKAGSGWAQQYFGGDGSCAAFYSCLCSCGTSPGADPLNCATMTCIASLDQACQTAVQSADTCIKDKCATECR